MLTYATLLKSRKSKPLRELTHAEI